MSEAILSTQAIEQEDHQTKDWSPAKVIYTVLMAIALLSHLWLILIGAGIEDIPTCIWIIRLCTVSFAIYLGKLWKDRGFQILSLYFLLFFLRCFIPDPGSIFSVKAAESILAALWLFAGCYGLAKVLSPNQLKRFLSVNVMVWIAGMAILCCLGIYTVWTEQTMSLFGGNIYLSYDDTGEMRLELVYTATTSGAIMGITILIGTIQILCIKNKYFKRVLLLLLIPIIIAMALTDSRTAFVSASMGLAIMAFSRWYQYYQKQTKENDLHRKGNQLKAWIFGILIMGMVFVLLIIILLQITPAFNRIRTQSLIPSAFAETTKKTDVAVRGFSGDRILSGRTELWTNIINYINQNRNILLTGASKNIQLVVIDRYYSHCHSLYFQALLESGIPGLLLIIAFIVYTMINVIRVITYPELPLWIRLIPAVFVSLAVADLAECFLWLRASQGPMIAVFFIAASILNTLVPKQKKKEKALSDPAIK